MAHFPKTACSFIPPRVFFSVLYVFAPGVPFPVGLSFSTKLDLDKAIAYNKGNAAYDRHYFDTPDSGLIGPMPDMGKGMTNVVVKGGAPDCEEMAR